MKIFTFRKPFSQLLWRLNRELGMLSEFTVSLRTPKPRIVVGGIGMGVSLQKRPLTLKYIGMSLRAMAFSAEEIPFQHAKSMAAEEQVVEGTSVPHPKSWGVARCWWDVSQMAMQMVGMQMVDALDTKLSFIFIRWKYDRSFWIQCVHHLHPVLWKKYTSWSSAPRR